MKKVKITKRDRFVALITLVEALKADEVNVVEDFDYDGTLEFMANEIDLLDKKAVKAKENAKTKKAEADVLTNILQEALTDEALTVNELVDKVGNEELTNAKAVYRLNALAKAGIAVKEEKTIGGGEGAKSRKVVAFKLA